MAIFSFRGGVHPPYYKQFSAKKSIETPPFPDLLVVPVVQHIGAPCKPVVNKGDMVKEGQVIAEASAFVSAPVHAPVSGKVSRVEDAYHPLGMKTTSIFIQPEGEEKQYLNPLGEQVDSIDPGEMLARVKEAGIVGLGGATFPTHVKFSPPRDKPIDTLILNGCECEPYLTSDHRLMLERTEDLILGSRMIARILKVKRIIIAVENNKPDALEKLQNELRGDSIECFTLATKYPQGAEKMLIKALLEREVPSGGLPLDVGVVVSNVGTAVAVCEAVRDGKPLIERVVTVTGDGIKEPKNFLVRIGTPVSLLVELCGGTVGEVGKIIMGGPMMGISQPGFDVPVIKGTSGVVVLKEKSYMKEEYLPCIKCSFCVRACPVSLLPSRLSVVAEAQRWDMAEQLGVNDCIECGSCAYVCPSKRPIVQLVKTAKAKLREIKAKK